MNSKEKAKFRTSKEWKTFRSQLLIDHGNKCEICGIARRHGKGLNIHHLDESDYTNLTDEKFLVLCRSCHQELERLLRRKNFDIHLHAARLERAYVASKHRP